MVSDGGDEAHTLGEVRRAAMHIIRIMKSHKSCLRQIQLSQKRYIKSMCGIILALFLLSEKISMVLWGHGGGALIVLVLAVVAPLNSSASGIQLKHFAMYGCESEMRVWSGYDGERLFLYSMRIVCRRIGNCWGKTDYLAVHNLDHLVIIINHSAADTGSTTTFFASPLANLSMKEVWSLLKPFSSLSILDSDLGLVPFWQNLVRGSVRCPSILCSWQDGSANHMLHADTHNHHLGLCRCRAVHFCSGRRGGGRFWFLKLFEFNWKKREAVVGTKVHQLSTIIFYVHVELCKGI